MKLHKAIEKIEGCLSNPEERLRKDDFKAIKRLYDFAKIVVDEVNKDYTHEPCCDDGGMAFKLEAIEVEIDKE